MELLREFALVALRADRLWSQPEIDAVVSRESAFLLANVVLASATFTAIAILVVASARPSLNRLAHWNLHHRERVGLGLGSAVVVLRSRSTLTPRAGGWRGGDPRGTL